MVTSEVVPFLYLASVRRSLQCLVSTLTQAGEGGLLFRFTCSVALWGGRGAADKYHWRVWGALAVFRPQWICPHSRHVCFPRLHCSGSRLLSRERALSCGQFQFSGTPQKRRLGWACVLCLPRRAAQAARSLTGALSPGAVRLIPSMVPASASVRASQVHAPCVCSGELASSCNPPGRCHPSSISGSLWLETGGLFAVR